MTLLVTGTSGHLGRLAVLALLERGVAPAEIRAGARDLERIADLAALGVIPVALDYTDPASIAAAVGGVEKVLLVSGTAMGERVAQHSAVARAAHEAGVAQLVYTSAPKADATALVLAPEHAGTEAALAEIGIGHTILRNNWYAENYAATLAQAAETGSVAHSAGSGRVASAPRAEYAEAAAAVLTTDGHLGAVYELGGDTAWSFDEFAQAAAEVLGREVSAVALSPEDHFAALESAGLDAGTAGFVTALDTNIAAGELDVVTGDLARLLGRPTATLEQQLRALAG